MSRDLIFGDKWLVLMALGAGGVFIANSVGQEKFGDLLHAIDRVLYSIL